VSGVAADHERLETLRLAAGRELAGADALLVPTTPLQPTIAEVAAEPLAVNARLGTYTNFCNLLDMAAVAAPAGQADGGQFGVTVMAPAFADRVANDVARLLVERGARHADSSAVARVSTRGSVERPSASDASGW
jgi:allophanate hydrolase